MNKIYINTDGGSRGNPGPAGIGAVFYDCDSKVIHTFKKYIGHGTNNEAEYEAILQALKILAKSQWLKDSNVSDHQIICRLDSQLVVEQLNGRYKIKQPHIQKYVTELLNIIQDCKLTISFIHIPREENKEADKLVNQALDEELKAKQS